MKLSSISAPVYVHLDITRRCNHNCFYCSIRDNLSPNVDAFSIDHFKKLIDAIADSGAFHVSFFGGEPFLYNGIYELADYAKSKGLDVGFLSNGSLIKNEDVSKIKTSFDAGTIALNGIGKYHDTSVGVNGAFDRAYGAIKSLSEAGFTTGIDVLIYKDNLDHLDAFFEWAGEKLPNVSLFNVNLFLSFDNANADKTLSVDETKKALAVMYKYSKKKNFLGKIKLGAPLPYCVIPEKYSKLRTSCSAGWSFGSVDYYGDVRVCSWGPVVLGNVLEKPLKEIWTKSDGIKQFRSFKWADGSCKKCKMLKFCTCGCKVTKKDPPYSLAEQWKPHVKPMKVVK